MLAKRRDLVCDGSVVERTPLLVPSFSSKGFPELGKIVQTTSEFITGATLVSAYDLHYELIAPPFSFASFIFLDSGGYEASKDKDLSDIGDVESEIKIWTPEMHAAVLDVWKSTEPTALVSYDHPNARVSVAEQIGKAQTLGVGHSNVMRELLLKPETETQRLLRVDSILKHSEELAKFDIIGVTEKELGTSILDRMVSIARLRRGLDAVKPDIPIHVFGSLDTVTTPMYFLAGADIFDGLTWLRFAYYQGGTIYKHNYGAVQLGFTTKAFVLDGRCWSNNLAYLEDMQLEMRRFLTDADFAHFRYHSDLFSRAHSNLMEIVGD